MLSSTLLNDAVACAQVLDALPEDAHPSVYFKQGSLAVITDSNVLNDNDAILTACKPMVDTLHGSGSASRLAVVGKEVEGPKEWVLPVVAPGSAVSPRPKAAATPPAEGASGGGSNYILLVARSSTVKVACVPHSESTRAEWMAAADLPNALVGAPPSAMALLEMDEGQILFLAQSMPWLLKEGLVGIFNLTVGAVKLNSPPKQMKPKTYDECTAKLTALKERIARLDKRVWNPQGPNRKAIQTYETTVNSASDKKTIGKYASCLGTLESSIHEAEHDTVLPGLLVELDEVRVVMDTKMGHVLQKSRTKCRKLYDELVGAEYNLVSKAKAVHDLLAEVKALADGTATTPKLRTNVTAPAAAATAVSIPEIDAGALTPYIIDHAEGPDGYKAVIGTIQKEHKSNFATMTQSLKHEGVSALHQKWIDEASKMQQQVMAALRDPSLSVDVTLYVAYADALKKVYDDTKASVVVAPPGFAGGSNGGFFAPAPAPGGAAFGAGGAFGGGAASGGKTIKCSECDVRRKEFCGTKMCKGCYQDVMVTPQIEQLEERADLLHRQMNREAEEDGPIHALYDEFVPINEKLAEAFEAFKPPNAPVSTWEKLKAIVKQADDMLPGKKLSAEGDDEEDEEEFDSDDADAIVLHSDEESASSSSSSSSDEDVKPRKRGRESDPSASNEADGLAHEALETLYRLPVSTVHESILENYHSKRYVLVEEELKRLDEVKEVYGFTVQAVRKDDKGHVEEDEPEEWHTFFLKRGDAVKLANSTAVPDRIRTKVITKRVRDQDGEDGEASKKESKKEEEEEDDE